MPIIKHEPHGQLTNFNFQRQFSLTVKEGNNMREVYNSDTDRTRLEQGILVYNGDVVRIARQAPSPMAQEMYDLHNVTSGALVKSESVSYSEALQRVIEATLTITGDADDSVIAAVITRNNSFM